MAHILVIQSKEFSMLLVPFSFHAAIQTAWKKTVLCLNTVGWCGWADDKILPNWKDDFPATMLGINGTFHLKELKVFYTCIKLPNSVATV